MPIDVKDINCLKLYHRIETIYIMRDESNRKGKKMFRKFWWLIVLVSIKLILFKVEGVINIL